jgi:hypothetical protein
MRVVKPVTFVPATHLISSNAAEAYSAWSSGTTYANNVIVDYGTHLYQSLQPSNTAHQPDTSPTWWAEIGPDNTHAMFDSQVSTVTTSSSPLTIVLATGAVNCVALLGLVGTTLTVSATDGPGGPSIYSRTVDLDGTQILDWYDYFFESFSQLTEVVLTDLPPYGNSRLTLSLTSGSSVAIGQVVFGNSYFIGHTEYGATAGIIDYSRKDTDSFGVTTFVQRAYSKRMSARLMLKNTALNRVQQLLSGLRATPCVWIGTDDSDYNPLVVYGFYRDFSLDVAYPQDSYCSLEIEGLT